MELIKTVVSILKGDSMNSRKTHYFIYPRDKSGKRTGQTIAILIHEGKAFHGLAMCSEEDSFCKATGRELALERAYEALERHLDRLSK